MITVWDKEIAVCVMVEGVLLDVDYHLPPIIDSTRAENIGPVGYVTTV
jgi:hypothetical protein